MSQARCAVDVIKPRWSHADLCRVSIDYCVSIYCTSFFQLNEDVENNNVDPVSGSHNVSTLFALLSRGVTALQTT